MEAGDTKTMALILKQYKDKSGAINFPAVLSVPSNERLPALYANDFMRATALVVGALTMAFEKMRFKNMDGGLINDIAEEILNSCDEDNISLEDLVLFLQNMVRGKYGTFESMSVAKFMNLFDKYRDDRHYALLEYRENEHLQFKSMGDANRSARQDPLADHFNKLGSSLHELRMQLSEQKKETNVIKMADKFYGNDSKGT
jgi:hypothetical protein